MTKRAVPLRTVAVLAIGVALLGAILYYASTVDARGPSVVGISLTQHLAEDAEMALTTSSLTVDFSEPVQHGSAEAAFAISPRVDGAFSWSAASLTFTPAARLPLNTRFEVTIGAGVRDEAGNPMVGGNETFHFATVGNPMVVASDPADAAEDVPLDGPIVVEFSTLMDTASVERAITVTPAAAVSLRWSGERLTIVTATSWRPNQRYLVTIGVGARDQAGTPLAHPFQLTFRTVASGLSVTAMVPAEAVAGIAVTTPIALVFDRALDPKSVSDGLITITPAVAGSLEAIPLPGAAGLGDGEARTLRFQPSGPLDPNTTYQVSLGPGLRGLDGAGLPAGLAWTFTTGAPTATLSNQIVFLSDRSGIANLWAMNPDGSNQRQLSAELSAVTTYSVSSDGRAFVTGDGARIVWQRADGAARSVLGGPDVLEFDAAFSPDGSVITFARADRELGSGLGLWMVDADGTDPRQIELPASVDPSPSQRESTRVALLRAPRLSPDGTALAFVDEAGKVAILDLELKQLSAAPFVAYSEPRWLPGGSGVLVAGLPAGAATTPQLHPPQTPVSILDPASGRLAPSAVAALQVVELNRFATSVRPSAFGGSAARPASQAGAGFAFIRLGGVTGGSLWLADTLTDAGAPVTIGPILIATATFAPEPGSIVIGQGPSGGVWLLHPALGDARQLSPDGWLPRWLP